MSVVVVNEANFKAEVLEAKEPVLVDFWAEWCAPCKQQLPILEEVAKELKNKAKIAKVDIEENRTIAQQYAVRSIPTLILLKDGKVVETLVGVQTKSKLVDVINNAVK